MSGKIWLLTTLLLMTASFAEAQQPKKVPRIAYLGGGSAELEKAWLDAFLQGLRQLGYFEGKNIVVERRFAAGRSAASGRGEWFVDVCLRCLRRGPVGPDHCRTHRCELEVVGQPR